MVRMMTHECETSTVYVHSEAANFGALYSINDLHMTGKTAPFKLYNVFFVSFCEIAAHHQSCLWLRNTY